MMRFRWQGSEYAADVIRKLADGSVIARALSHGPRFAIGTEIKVAAHEIVSMDEPVPPDTDPKALQAAMDAERKALPSVAEVIADPNPTPPLSDSPAAAPIRSTTMPDNSTLSRIQEKARLAAGATAEVAAAVEKSLDDILAQKAALLERNENIHARHTKIIGDAQAGLDVMENALHSLSNGGPA